jgi:glycosyltransferase involved in cell wall biosynthesis
MDKVSVIIPTYNRYNYFLQCVGSVQNQTHGDIEIIAVNDGSTQPEYYRRHAGVTMIHLPENSQQLFGFPCGSYVRNCGLGLATGDYVAFVDDDDVWLPQKVELQLAGMKACDVQMSCTEGLYGRGFYDPNAVYPKYNKEHYWHILRRVMKLEDDFPDIWGREFIRRHNAIICSSVVLNKELLLKTGPFKHVRNGLEDYDYWLRCLEHTNCLYLKSPLTYYDGGHGGSVQQNRSMASARQQSPRPAGQGNQPV